MVYLFTAILFSLYMVYLLSESVRPGYLRWMMLKMKTRYPTHLHFDSSQSAMAKFFGEKVAHLEVHSVPVLRQVLSVCPESVGMLGLKCKACEEGFSSHPRLAALAWDMNKERWCIYLSSSDTFSKILSAAGTASRLAFGKAPGMILQREGNMTLVEAIDTKVKTKGSRPELDDFLRGLEAKSHWARPKGNE